MALLFTNFSTASAEIDWTHHVPLPCSVFDPDEICDTMIWGELKGPFEKNTSVDGCSFKVIYYERMDLCRDPQFTDRFLFNVMVVSIVYDDPNCTNIDKKYIYNNFYTSLIQNRVSQSPNFKDSLHSINKTTGHTLTSTQSLMITGKCVDTLNGNNCTGNVCCRKMTSLNWIENSNTLSQVTVADEYSFHRENCPPGCTYDCDGVQMLSMDQIEEEEGTPFGCGFDCDWGRDTTVTTTYFDPICNCLWEYTYRYRYNEKCTPTAHWHDFKLENIKLLSGTNCQPSTNPWTNPPTPCNTNYDLVYQTILNEMLRTSMLAQGLEQNECVLNVRASSTACKKWQDAFGFPPRTEMVTCGSDSNCCISYWQICKNDLGIITTIFVGSNNQDNCENYTYEYYENTLACFSVCPTYPAQINYNDSKGQKTLFNNEELIALLEKSTTLDVENNFLIQFYEYNGALKFSQNIEKSQISQTNFTNQFNQKGWIPYTIQNGNKFILSGYLNLGD